MDLVELIGTPYAASPNTALIAFVSLRSLAGVLVPWALTYVRSAISRGLRRARKADTVEAGLVGACDGDLAVGQILDALATLLDGEPSDLRREYLPVVRDLLVEGFLTGRG